MIRAMKWNELFTREEVEEIVVDILAEIQSEIEEKFNDRPFSYNHQQIKEFYRDINEVIQKEINAIEENTDGME